MSKLKETKEQRAAEYAKAAELLKQEQTPELVPRLTLCWPRWKR